MAQVAGEQLPMRLTMEGVSSRSVGSCLAFALFIQSHAAHTGTQGLVGTQWSWGLLIRALLLGSLKSRCPLVSVRAPSPVSPNPGIVPHDEPRYFFISCLNSHPS